MTTEEKAKAYDNALKRIREFYLEYDNISNLIDVKRELESIFPQLCESEDEQTRRRLIEFISDIKEISESGRNSWAIRKEDVEMCNAFLSYLEKQKELPFVKDVMLGYPGLYFYDGERMHFRGPAMEEKQKEQKPDIELIQRSWYMEGYKDHEYNHEPKWIIKTGDDGPKYELNSKYGKKLAEEQKLETFNEPYNPDEYEVVMKGNATNLKRKEQKPVDYEHEMWKNCEANFEGGKKEVIEHPEKYGLQKEQKPVISDEAIRDGVVHFGITQYQIDNWLKKYINIVEQKPAEWSEEDEKNLGQVISGRYLPLGLREWFCGLPERFPSRSSWKPSEEQKEPEYYQHFDPDC